MIFNRPTNLWLAVLTGLFNLSVLFHWLGFAPSPEQIAGVNVLIFAAVGLISNTASAAAPDSLRGSPKSP